MHTGAETSAAKEQKGKGNTEEIGHDGKNTKADSDGADEVMKYNVGDAVRTINGLVADVVAVNEESRTYDIKYRKDADVDKNVYPKFFKPYVPPTRKRPSETNNWEYREEPVETAESFIARTGVSAEFNVLPPGVKRRRG
jgi:preprotein translocase subunit YajC